ncbi:MAG: hypothetical protein Q8S13_02115 [Dehalococcoidia bacterium]|nr:hypothetical protein [Dehalococcoidia bacterium]
MTDTSSYIPPAPERCGREVDAIEDDVRRVFSALLGCVGQEALTHFYPDFYAALRVSLLDLYGRGHYDAWVEAQIARGHAANAATTRVVAALLENPEEEYRPAMRILAAHAGFPLHEEQGRARAEPREGTEEWQPSAEVPAEMRFVSRAPLRHWQRHMDGLWQLIVPDGRGTFTLYCGNAPDVPGLSWAQAKIAADAQVFVREEAPRDRCGAKIEDEDARCERADGHSGRHAPYAIDEEDVPLWEVPDPPSGLDPSTPDGWDDSSGKA